MLDFMALELQGCSGFLNFVFIFISFGVGGALVTNTSETTKGLLGLRKIYGKLRL